MPDHDPEASLFGGSTLSGDEQRKVTFQEFVSRLSARALFQMGFEQNSSTGKTTVQLPAAQRTIDLLTLLEEKTKGNLTQDEQKVLQSALYDLRMRYVKAAQAQRDGKE